MQSVPVSKAKWMQDSEGTWISFCVPAAVAAGMVSEVETGEHQLVLKKQSKKRSLDANGYFWTLVGSLSAKIGSTPKEIYREYIRDIGGNYYIVPVRKDLVVKFCDEWCAGHDGRIAEDMGPCRNTTGYNNIRVYIGSSDYDSVQMGRLIDMAIADCKECGIETITPKDRDLLLKEWSGYELGGKQ